MNVNQLRACLAEIDGSLEVLGRREVEDGRSELFPIGSVAVKLDPDTAELYVVIAEMPD